MAPVNIIKGGEVAAKVRLSARAYEEGEEA